MELCNRVSCSYSDMQILVNTNIFKMSLSSSLSTDLQRALAWSSYIFKRGFSKRMQAWTVHIIYKHQKCQSSLWIVKCSVLSLPAEHNTLTTTLPTCEADLVRGLTAGIQGIVHIVTWFSCLKIPRGVTDLCTRRLGQIHPQQDD